MEFYTYAHYTADTKELFYIGKGKEDRAWNQTHRNTYWKRKVAKHGVLVEILCYWEIEQDALEHEKFLISCFKHLGTKLCNLTDGGQGLSGHVFSEEHKAKIGKAHKGRKKSLGQVEKQRVRMVSYMEDPSNRETIRQKLLGRKLSEEHKQKIKEGSTVRRAVLCITTGIVYPSAFEACEILGISSSSSVAKCCRGKRKTAGGFEWKYIDG